MSYITSIINPDNLYIYAGSHGVTIHQENAFTENVPIKDFNKLLRKCVSNFHIYHEEKEITVNGLSVSQEIINNKVKIKLSYKNDDNSKDWKLFMYPVTWEYIVYSRAKPYELYTLSGVFSHLMMYIKLKLNF